MTLHLANVTLDCDDPQKVGTFWSAALDLPIDEGASPYFVTLGRADDSVSPNWFFLKVPEAKTVKNRVHVELGASHVADKDEWGLQWTVLADVEGNEFCVAGG